jgi:hypothetical protein
VVTYLFSVEVGTSPFSRMVKSHVFLWVVETYLVSVGAMPSLAFWRFLVSLERTCLA